MRVLHVPLVLILIGGPSVAAGADPATPTPAATATPAPRTLAGYAACRPLSAASARTADGRIELTDRNLGDLGAGGALTRPAAPAQPPVTIPTPPPVDPRLKRRWQAAVARRRKAVTRLEHRRTTLEVQLDRVRDASPTARTLAREDEIRALIRALDRELTAARNELARVQREARREGAEPGWFREP